MKKLRVFEAFAGVGSQTMALRNINCNYEVVGISEVDRYALLAYDAIHNNDKQVDFKTKDEMLEEIKLKNIAYNFSTGKSEIPRKEEEIRKIYKAHIKSNNFGDIRLINPKKLPDFDLFTYSFPCKDISVEGNQKGFDVNSDTKSSLIWECEKIIKEKKPKFLMMENVKNIVSKRHKPQFDIWCKILEDIGYTNYWKIYNGNQFKVPQSRERVIMISILNEYVDKIKFEHPEGNKTNKVLLDIIDTSNIDEYIVEDKDIEGLIEIIDNKKLKVLSENILSEAILYTNKESEEFIQQRKKHLPLYEDFNDVSILVREATKLGYKIADIGDSINLNQKNSKTRRGRIGKKEAKTLDTSCNMCIVLKDYRLKKLSPLEAWRLQGFSDEDFNKTKKLGIPESKLYERAGRGIVVPMLEEIFKNLCKEYIL